MVPCVVAKRLVLHFESPSPASFLYLVPTRLTLSLPPAPPVEIRSRHAGLETNDDHWKPAEDKRRNAGNAHMKNVGHAAMTLDAMLKDVLSQPPNLTTSTTYTSIFSASLGVYTTIVREHNRERDGMNSFMYQPPIVVEERKNRMY